jgi:hypothetical protein
MLNNKKLMEDTKIESINYKIWKKFIRNRLALAGLIILSIMFLLLFSLLLFLLMILTK